MRKISQDTNAISGFRMFIIIIIISLLFWQFGIPYIDDTVKTPSDYILELAGIDVMPENLNFESYIKNIVTNVEYSKLTGESYQTAWENPLIEISRSPTNRDYYINGEGGMEYRIGFKTNLPPSIKSDKWTITYLTTVYNPSTSGYAVGELGAIKIGLNALTTDTFELPLQLYYDHSLIVFLTLYNPAGDIVITNSNGGDWIGIFADDGATFPFET